VAITDHFVLPEDVVLQPASDFSEKLRSKIAAEVGDYVLSRPTSRSLSKVIDAEAAALIREFEKPCTIGQAVARYSRGKPDSPEKLLESALPLFGSLLVEGLLVKADSILAERIQPSLATETQIDGWEVIRCVQALEDTEVYQARNSVGKMAALKIGRPGGPSIGVGSAGEADLLRGVEGRVAPAVLAQAEWNGRPYLLLEWIAGAEAHMVCAEFCERSNAESLATLIRITGAILNAYAELHEQGIVHGDVHPRNVLIDRDGAVRIIDFGLARRVGQDLSGDHGQRGGVSQFLEPEFAKAALGGLAPPAATFAGEQYALGALLYLLLTGQQYQDFAFERNEMLRQIAEVPMTPFTERGIEPWPEVERLLSTALDKNPNARFTSVREFASAWQGVSLPMPTELALPLSESVLQTVRAEVLEKVGFGGPLQRGEPLPSPTTSLNYGSAGIAYALYRMACAIGDAELLALADVWITRAGREEDGENAFYCDEIEITPETVGRNSLHHSAAGVRLVQALIAQAQGDASLQLRATGEFMELSQEASPKMDVCLGRAGTLLGCVFLLDALRMHDATMSLPEQKLKLTDFGNEVVTGLWKVIDEYGAIGRAQELTNFGVAHGWAGLLYATLCWSSATSEAPPRSLQERLAQLAGCAEPAGRGLQWKWDASSAEAFMPGWCNGSAGYVFLWTAAHRVFGDARYEELAEGAGWNAWEAPNPDETLCCGEAGRAYAMLNLYRHTGEPVWLERARRLAVQAADRAIDSGRTDQNDFRPLSLYKGHLGIALLAADIESPLYARMPAFEREGQ
jgi:eukaryotic-like serine/threonine-protein kinase